MKKKRVVIVAHSGEPTAALRGFAGSGARLAGVIPSRVRHGRESGLRHGRESGLQSSRLSLEGS